MALVASGSFPPIADARETSHLSVGAVPRRPHLRGLRSFPRRCGEAGKSRQHAEAAGRPKVPSGTGKSHSVADRWGRGFSPWQRYGGSRSVCFHPFETLAA